MSLSVLPRRSMHSASTAPIKGSNKRGFVIGWVAIIALAVAGYAFASSHLSPSSAQLSLAHIAGDTYPVFARS